MSKNDQVTREEVKSGLIEILKTIHTIDQSRLKNISDDTDFIADLGAPSTEIVNIIAKAEERFGLEFDDDEVDDLSSKVKDTIDLIMRSKQKKQ
jgi:acyl carrier protein